MATIGSVNVILKAQTGAFTDGMKQAKEGLRGLKDMVDIVKGVGIVAGISEGFKLLEDAAKAASVAMHEVEAGIKSTTQALIEQMEKLPLLGRAWKASKEAGAAGAEAYYFATTGNTEGLTQGDIAARNNRAMLAASRTILAESTKGLPALLKGIEDQSFDLLPENERGTAKINRDYAEQAKKLKEMKDSLANTVESGQVYTATWPAYKAAYDRIELAEKKLIANRNKALAEEQAKFNKQIFDASDVYGTNWVNRLGLKVQDAYQKARSEGLKAKTIFNASEVENTPNLINSLGKWAQEAARKISEMGYEASAEGRGISTFAPLVERQFSFALPNEFAKPIQKLQDIQQKQLAEAQRQTKLLEKNTLAVIGD